MHDTAVELQLPATLLGVDKTHGPPSIQRRSGLDVCHIRGIATDAHGLGQTGQLQCAVESGQAAQHLYRQHAAHEQHSDHHEHTQTSEPFHKEVPLFCIFINLSNMAPNHQRVTPFGDQVHLGAHGQQHLGLDMAKGQPAEHG